MNPPKAHFTLSITTVILLAACALGVSFADDNPPTPFRSPEQYMRAAIPQSPISHATTSGGAPQIVQRASTTVCFPHYTQMSVQCNGETFFFFSESQSLTSVSVGASWAEDLADPEGDATLRNLVGPASGNAPHGFVVRSSGWKFLVTPGPLKEDDVGFRGGYCLGGTTAGWPCNGDADCSGGGTCENEGTSTGRRRCMFLHSEAAADSTCYVEVYR